MKLNSYLYKNELLPILFNKIKILNYTFLKYFVILIYFTHYILLKYYERQNIIIIKALKIFKLWNKIINIIIINNNLFPIILNNFIN